MYMEPAAALAVVVEPDFCFVFVSQGHGLSPDACMGCCSMRPEAHV